MWFRASLIVPILLLAGAAPPEEGDAVARWPALKTTLVEPEADGGRPLTYCAVLDGRRLCEEALAERWCRKQGFAAFDRWTTAGHTDPVACAKDDAACAIVTTITCARTPIISEDEG
jgi:hypothetical protein